MKTAHLGDIALVFNGNSISAAEKDKHYRDAQGMPYVGTAEVGFDTEINYDAGVSIPAAQLPAFKVAQAGTALVCAEGGSAGRKVGYLDREVCFGNKLFAMQPKAGWDGKFLFYFAQSEEFREQFRALTTGLIGGVSVKKFKGIQVPNFSRNDQRRIVAVLDEAFAAIAAATVNAEKNLANARELSAMFPASQSDDKTRLTIGELLESGWLKGHMDGNHGCDYPRKDEFVDGGVTYLSANCIRDGLVDFRRAKFLTNERAGKLRKGFAKHRDVLFAHNATVGPVALLQTDADFVVLGTSLTYYRCDEEVILPEYLASYLRSPSFVGQYSAVMRQSTRNQVPITKQREFFVDLPPIAQQRSIVASLSGFQEDGRTLAKLYKVKLNALSALKQSLLHRAFTGEQATMAETIAA